MNISLVIPVYNEHESLCALWKQIQKTLDAGTYVYEVIFVNDGSSDGSHEVLDGLAKESDKIRVVHLRRNFGQTAAMMAGIDRAAGEVIIPLDSDLQNDPADIPKLLAKIDEGYDVCSGWRKDRKDAFLNRRLPSLIANSVISLISGVKLRDYGCTLKAYRRRVLKGVRLYGDMHRFIPIYAAWQGAKVAEIPVNHQARKFGRSHYGINRTLKVLLDLLVIVFLARYAAKPIHVFGLFAVANFLGSIASFGAMVWFKYWGDKSFVETPLPLLVVMFGLMGVFSIFLGFIAEILMRTYYESQGKSVYLVEE